jgi:hypothetical protein
MLLLDYKSREVNGVECNSTPTGVIRIFSFFKNNVDPRDMQLLK